MVLPELLKQAFFRIREPLRNAIKQKESDILSSSNPPTADELRFMKTGGWKYGDIDANTNSPKWTYDPTIPQLIANEVNERLDISQWLNKNETVLMELQRSGVNTSKISSGTPIFHEGESLENPERFENKGCTIFMPELKKFFSGVMVEGQCIPMQ